MTRVAVVLFNLGGPDRPEAVRPFLFNLFNDSAIIDLPQPVRFALAALIARRRSVLAGPIYAAMGGASPLLANTRAQAAALEAELASEASQATAVRVFVCMRYWHPKSMEVQREVEAFKPDRVILLPLYPQYSTTTTRSSIKDWRCRAREPVLRGEAVCCYPDEPGWIEALAARTREGLARLTGPASPRLIFSAHGLPKRVVARGDPYAWQVERTCRAVVAHLGIAALDWVLAYQSQIGPLEWIGPTTISEIERAGRERKGVVIVPVAFVSEHSETLVELDIDYRHLAERAGVPEYIRSPSVGTHPAFIGALAALVRRRLAAGPVANRDAIVAGAGQRLCPAASAGCALQAAASARG